MANPINLTGIKFGNLTVLKLDENSTSKHRKWHCKCDCGNSTSVYATNLKSCATTSCGCKSSRHEHKLKEINTKHGLSRSKIYHVYHSVKNRCFKKTNKHYKDYGARGIIMCDEWKTSFETFYNWATSNGYKEGLTLERMDVNGNYDPENCTWITQSEQCNNKRTTLYATINGETKTLKEWSEISGITYNTLFFRKEKYKWSDERLLEKPTPYHRY